MSLSSVASLLSEQLLMISTLCPLGGASVRYTSQAGELIMCVYYDNTAILSALPNLHRHSSLSLLRRIRGAAVCVSMIMSQDHSVHYKRSVLQSCTV